jgi:hypothetical protein
MGGKLLIDVAGWTGVVALLVAYGLVSTKRMDGESFAYQALNIAGAGLLIVNSLYYGAYPSVVINVIWIGIGFFALFRVWKKFGGR